MSKRAVVLGAGCAGLAAGWRLRQKGFEVVMVEADDHVGGLAGGVSFDGNVYEYGPHIFHTTDPELLAEIKALMGADLRAYQRTIKIKFQEEYFDFPLKVADVLWKLPPATVLHAGGAFIRRYLEGLWSRPAVENSETLLIRSYGDVLYKIFFKDYISRVWGIPPAAFSPAFARERIPRLNFLEWAEKLSRFLLRPFRPAVRLTASGYVEKTEGELYTTREGFSLITRRMAERFEKAGGSIRLKTRATAILREGRRVRAVEVAGPEGLRELPCDLLLNTLPVNEAVRMVRPGLGSEVDAAAGALRFRAIVFVGLQVAKPRVLPASFMYFREHAFNRITDLSHFGIEVTPAGTTILVAEVTCDPKDRIWSDDAAACAAVVADLQREGMLDPKDIVASHVFRARHAHPMYTLGYEQALDTVLKAFTGLDCVETAGRQGRFQYVNAHVAMDMGYEAAERAAARLV
ncbi:MAG: FAD-dependent oxidoreductase [Elusimicrobiota bacterium]|jgi:protoporphyrinogen oxidase